MLGLSIIECVFNNFDIILSGIFGGLVGSLVIAIVTLHIARKNTREKYYTGLIERIEQHNWKSYENKLDPGLGITQVKPEVKIICYQHLNLLLYAYFHKDVIAKDKSIQGWKNWAESIVEGAKEQRHGQFSRCYHEILTNGDLYPSDFLNWLKKEIKLSAKAFPITSEEN